MIKFITGAMMVLATFTSINLSALEETSPVTPLSSHIVVGTGGALATSVVC